MEPVIRQDESCGDEALPRERSSSLKSQRNIVVTRPIFSQDKFDTTQEFADFGQPARPWQKLKRGLRRKITAVRQWHPSVCGLLLAMIRSLFPALKWLPEYQFRKDIGTDLLSGLTVGIMSIPSGMAYSLLASMPAIFGLYTSFFPSLVYAVMATSRHVSIGVFAIVSIMTGKVVQQYALPTRAVAGVFIDNFSIPLISSASATTDADGDVSTFLESRIRVVMAVTVAVGIWQLLMGLLGLGYLTVYLSDQLVTGFTAGTAVHVFTSQLKSIFGLQRMKEYNGPFKLIYTYIDFFSMLKNTHVPTLIISVICINFLLIIKYTINENQWIRKRKRLRVNVPGELLIVIFGTLASYYLNLDTAYGVAVVGAIPLGIPAPRVPDLSILPAFAVDTFAIAIVSFAITLSLAKMYAMKHKYKMDSNQELRALGCSNIFAGFFQCVPSTGFLGRVTAQSSVGGESQVVSLVSAGFILIVLLFVGNLMRPLPKACLGCIIIVALINMLRDIGLVRKIWKVSAVDTSIFVVSLLAVCILDVDIGLGVAVGWSLLTVVFRTQRPDVSVLGRALHTDIYKRISDYKSVAEVDGCKIVSFSAPLYFANADYFLHRVRSITKLNRSQHTSKGPDRTITVESLSSPLPHHGLSFPLEHLHLPHHSNSHSPNGHSAEHDSHNHASYHVRNGCTFVDVGTWTADHFDQPIKHVIVDCSSMSFVDINGIHAIQDLATQCSATGMALFLTSCKADLKEKLALRGYSKDLNADHIFEHVHDAVMQAVREHEGNDHDTLDTSILVSSNVGVDAEAKSHDATVEDSLAIRNTQSLGTQTSPERNIVNASAFR